MSFWNNYKSTCLLLAGVVIGGSIGLLFPAAVVWLRPVGQIFLNLMFVLIVPLVFLSMSSAVCRLNRQHIAGRVLCRALVTFILMALMTGLMSYIGCRMYNPLDSSFDYQTVGMQHIDLGDLIVSTLTVPDFVHLLEKQHMLPLIIIALLTGLAVAKAGDKGHKVAEALDCGNMVIMHMVDLIMLAAPIGLGCYFASAMADMGKELIGGYLRVFLLYILLTCIILLIVNPLIVFIRTGKEGLTAYIKNMVEPSLMAVATCSSTACMPVSIRTCNRLDLPSHISETVIPLGLNLFKQGSVLSCVIKVIFTMLLAGLPIDGFGTALFIIGIAITAACVVSAVPSGGMTGELFICAVLGVDPHIAGILLVIATILDIPATLLNVTGNITAAVAVKNSVL